AALGAAAVVTAAGAVGGTLGRAHALALHAAAGAGAGGRAGAGVHALAVAADVAVGAVHAGAGVGDARAAGAHLAGGALDVVAAGLGHHARPVAGGPGRADAGARFEGLALSGGGVAELIARTRDSVAELGEA